MALAITNDTDRGRFSAKTEHGEARLDYERVDDETLDYRHTFVPEEDREGGLGEELVLHALDWAEDHGLRVIPTCPFVKSVLEDHREYDEIVAAKR